MADARRRDAWTHTSCVLAMLVNLNRDPKAKAVSPSDFNPYLKLDKPNRPVPKVSIRDLKGVFFPDATKSTPGALIGGGKSPVDLPESLKHLVTPPPVTGPAVTIP